MQQLKLATDVKEMLQVEADIAGNINLLILKNYSEGNKKASKSFNASRRNNTTFIET